MQSRRAGSAHLHPFSGVSGPSPSYLSCLMSSEPARLLRNGSCRIKHKWISNQHRTVATSHVVKVPSTLGTGLCWTPLVLSGQHGQRGHQRRSPWGQETSSAPSTQWSRECHGTPPRSLKHHRQRAEVPSPSRAAQTTSCPGLSERPRAQGLRLGQHLHSGQFCPANLPSSLLRFCPLDHGGQAAHSTAPVTPQGKRSGAHKAVGPRHLSPWSPALP